MLSQKIIDKYSLYKPYGTEIDNAATSGDRVASVYFKADDEFSLQEKREIFLKNCKVLNDKDEDIMKRDMWEASRK